jgi:hypothetical protein
MPTLPPEFAELEPFASWSLETESERYAKRLASTMDELQAFYDAAFPRLDEAMVYLDTFELSALPEEAQHLLWLCYSLVNASFPVEAEGARQWCRQPGHAGRTVGLISAPCTSPVRRWPPVGTRGASEGRVVFRG